jgi:hypothetical protein
MYRALLATLQARPKGKDIRLLRAPFAKANVKIVRG